MSESCKATSDIPFEDSIPEAGASLESILCTEELQRRPSRPPDYEKENCALVALVSALADSPSSILQTLAETILDITQCESAGLSLLTRDGERPDASGKRFYWPAIAGMWNPHVGGGTPRNFGPCGDVLDQNRTLLFRHFERRYPYLLPVIPAAEECLLVPFYVAGKAVGTIWAIMHSDRRKFDAEDDRVMGSLGRFASSAYQALVYIDDLKFQVAEREKAEAEVRELASGLEAKIRRLVEANVVGIVMWNLEGAITGANEAFLHIVQYAGEDIASGRVRWTDLTPAEWRGRDERAVADLKASGVFRAFEKEYFRKDGSRVPVLLGGALFERSGNEGVAFVLDLSEQKRAEAEIKALKDQLYKENIALRDEIDKASMFEEIVGASRALRMVLSSVTKVAPTDSTVLITGETGTGKELIARAIHSRSRRSSRAFVSVNCSAIPESLIASELFGHEKGAFTGALQQRLGRFELAEGGTIFLDEIGDLTPETQNTLLRVLQEHEFERVGGTQTIRAEVRVIAATNLDLISAMTAGAFRSALFYRLNVFPIETPSLRERKEDIPTLVEYFIDRYAGKAGKKIKSINKNSLELLCRYSWPGNIRELQNVIERSVIVSETETLVIDENWLPRKAVETPPLSRPLSEELVTREKERIEAALAATRGRVSGPSGAAAKLGIPPSTLDSKIRSLKINRHRFESV
jgi:PAS domain S-box-containing protein